MLIQLQFPEIKQLSTEDLAAWLLDDRAHEPLLLDAREQEEYEVSHLMNARLAPTNLKDLINIEGVNFSTPIVVYCSVGYRSAAIARRLQSIGYQKVFNLSGSIFQWVNESHLVYSEGKPVNRVHSYQTFWRYLLIHME
ncbi:MAG: rhodanese-like domain-containing protein [Xenococcaceae cyanobacterium]